MVQKSFPFADNNGDREYNDTDFANFYESLFVNGVFISVADALKVSQSPSAGMRINIGAGTAIINGRMYFNTEPTAVSIPVASSMQERQDSVVVRLDLAQRNMEIMYKQSDTTVIRDDLIYEIQLAVVTVPKNANNITNANIKDTRSDAKVCGYASPFEKVNVSGLEQEYERKLKDVMSQALRDAEKNKSDQEDIIDRNQSSFQDWFDKLNTALTGDVATNLQKQIDELNADTAMSVEIKHDLGGYPIPHAVSWQYGLGLVGLGDEPEGMFGGTNVKTIPVNAEYTNQNTIKLMFTGDFVLNNPKITDKKDGTYLIVDGHTSIGITLQSGYTN